MAFLEFEQSGEPYTSETQRESPDELAAALEKCRNAARCVFQSIRPPVPAGIRPPVPVGIRPPVPGNSAGPTAHGDVGGELLLADGGGRPGSSSVPEGFSFQVQTIGVMDEPIEDGVGQGGIAQIGMPVVHGELAGRQGGAPGVAVVEEFQEVAPLVGGEWNQAPVIEDEEVGFGEGGELLGETAVAVRQGEVLQEPRQAVVGDGEAEATGGLGQGAADPRFADPGRTDDQTVQMIAQPLAGGQVLDQGLVQTARGAVVEIFQAGGLAQAGLAQAGPQAALLAFGQLPVGEQAETFLEAEGVDLGEPLRFSPADRARSSNARRSRRDRRCGRGLFSIRRTCRAWRARAARPVAPGLRTATAASRAAFGTAAG